jgi:orotidine-5'-phosphate decarboxylase
MTTPQERLIVALDYPQLAPAEQMVDLIGSQVGMVKVGLELFNSAGPAALSAMKNRGADVFYDCKLYDIPNTVAGAARAIGRLGVRMFNVHTLGGVRMMRAAVAAAQEGAEEAGQPAPLVIGVTIVTSLSDEEVQQELGLPKTAEQAAQELAQRAKEAGLHGVVCSKHEIQTIKHACGNDFITVVPGIRPQASAVGDQARVATPREAIAAGADYLVIGRPITAAADPVVAVASIIQEMAG